MRDFKKYIAELGKNIMDKVLDASATAAVDYKTKVTAQQIAANANLVNFQRQMAREMPKLSFNPSQEEQLFFPEYRNQGRYIQLDHKQAEDIFQHMLRQHTLDKQSRQELITSVFPLVGVPMLMAPLYKVHRVIAEVWILPVLSETRSPDAAVIHYGDLMSNSFYWGSNQGVNLRYKVSPHNAKKLVENYENSGQYINEIREEFQKHGMLIKGVNAVGTYLDVFLKWTEE